MAGQSNAAPVIIKRKKKAAEHGHHGGAWKVAYADFVTAMMAFFLLMWLLNATTEKQRKGLSDYFNPTISANRTSGGGDEVLSGDSIFTEESMARVGTGADAYRATEADRARGLAGEEGQRAGEKELSEIEQRLIARGGESNTMTQALRHVVTRITDEGLVIELYDLPDARLFGDLTAEPGPVTGALVALVSEVLALSANRIAVQAHVSAMPVMLADNPVWDLSAARAQAVRALLEQAGTDPARLHRVTGYADRQPVTADGAAIRNNRVEIVLLRPEAHR
jgi:chemotaxis protein MotB